MDPHLQPPPFPRAPFTVYHVLAVASLLWGPVVLLAGGLLFAVAPGEDSRRFLLMLTPITSLFLLFGISASIIALICLPRQGAQRFFVMGLLGLCLTAATWIGLIMFSIVTAIHGKLPNGMTSGQENSNRMTENIHSVIEADVRAINQEAPVMLDDSRRLDGVKFTDNALVYDITIVDFPAPEIFIPSLRLSVYPIHRDAYMKGPRNAPYRKDQIPFVFRYHDNRGDFVTEIRITTQDDSAATTRALLKDFLAAYTSMLNETSTGAGSMRLDHCEVVGEREVCYDYTLTEVTKADSRPDFIQSQVRPRLVDSYKNDPHYDLLRVNDVTLIYRFEDRNGTPIGETTVGPGHLN